MSPGVAPAPGKSHSLAVGESFQKMYEGLDSNMQKTISSLPLVSQGHLSPAAALNILHYDKKPGEQLGDVVSRVALPSSIPSAPGGSSIRPRSMATVGPRPRSSSAFATGIG